jgi:hypothetical protein
MHCCKKPPVFQIQDEENLGLSAKLDIAEFMVVRSRLCLDRHSAAPNTPNFSSLPTHTLVRSHRSVETCLKEQLIPPNRISSLRILPFVYYTNMNADVPVLILTFTNDTRYNHKPLYLFWRYVLNLIGASEVNRPKSSLRITILLYSSDVDIASA